MSSPIPDIQTQQTPIPDPVAYIPQTGAPIASPQSAVKQTEQIIQTSVIGESRAIILDALGIVNVLVLAALLTLGYLLVAAVSFGSPQARVYLGDIFSPNGLIATALAAAGYALYRVIPSKA